jgi:predicted DNA-binding protein (MmcQ/YjbR family)
MPKVTEAAAARRALRAHALKHEGAWADEPWPGDHVVKVGKKIFVFLGGEGPEVSLGVKLPRSALFARAQPFVQKMGYGMDRSGWVAARLSKGERIPLELLRSWIDESYEAVAATLPKRKRAPAAKTTKAPAKR